MIIEREGRGLGDWEAVWYVVCHFFRFFLFNIPLALWVYFVERDLMAFATNYYKFCNNFDTLISSCR